MAEPAIDQEASSSSCFICQSTDSTGSLEAALIDCFCQLFSLKPPDTYHGALSKEKVCCRCDMLLQSVHSMMQEVDRLLREINDSRILMRRWVRESGEHVEYSDNHLKDFREKIIGPPDEENTAPATAPAHAAYEFGVSDVEEVHVYKSENIIHHFGQWLRSTEARVPEVVADVEIYSDQLQPPNALNLDPDTILCNQPTVSLRRMPMIDRFLKKATQKMPRPQVARRTSPKRRVERMSPSIPKGLGHVKLEPVDVEATEFLDLELNLGIGGTDSSEALPRRWGRVPSSRKVSVKYGDDDDDNDEDFQPKADDDADSLSPPQPQLSDVEDEEPEPDLPEGAVLFGPTVPPPAKGKHACRVCGKPFKTPEYARIHVRTHRTELPFKCNVAECTASYHTAKSLRRHLHEFHDPEKERTRAQQPQPLMYRKRKNPEERSREPVSKPVFVCEHCSSTFKARHLLLAHLDSHKPPSERKLVCEECGFGCYARHRMNKHMRQVHDPVTKREMRERAKRQCPECGLIVWDLSHHRKVHSDRKPFECSFCGQGFRRRESLAVHLRVHTGVRPFACDRCEAAFKTSHGLKRHAFIHSEERQFVCDTCGKSFRFKSSLTEHLHVHGSSKPHRCNGCGKRFKEREELQQHWDVDHGPNAEATKRKRDNSYRKRIKKQPSTSTASGTAPDAPQPVAVATLVPVGQTQSLILY